MVADIMTKSLTGEHSEKLRMMTGLQPMMNIPKMRSVEEAMQLPLIENYVYCSRTVQTKTVVII